jgi:AraC-like DNA-binding protein
MYKPVKDGIEKISKNVVYTETKPPNDLDKLVDNFWVLKTTKTLVDDFTLHVIPDGCVNILFNLNDPNIAAITARQNNYVELNLGKCFHYVGVQLMPGVWRGSPNTIADDLVDIYYTGELPLIETNKKLVGLDFASQQLLLSELVRIFKAERLVVISDTIVKIFDNLNTINSVDDMARVVGLSARHLQRILKKTTGFTPNNFLKILKLQQSFGRHYLNSYSDQSHFIHSFKDGMGYTPGEYFRKFKV